MSESPPPPRVFLLDAFGLIFRAYFAFAGKPLLSPDGRNVNAIFGFFKSLFQIVREHRPSHLAVVYDSPTATFRHELYPEYKAHRDAAPEDLIAQLPDILNLLEALGVPTLRYDGFEADDLLATVAQWCGQEKIACTIVSNDKDLLAMVGGSVTALRSDHKGGWREVDAEAVFVDRGVRPDQIADWLALVGDTADNIPGVKGIGEKSAVKLLADFGSVDGIYENLGNVESASWRTKLEDGRESAKLSKTLATLRTDVPLDLALDRWELIWKDGQRAAELFLSHNAKGLAKEAKVLGAKGAPSALPEPALPEVKGPQVLTGRYQTITKWEDWEPWLAKARTKKAASLDLETDSLDTQTARIVGLSLSSASGEAAYVPFLCQESGTLDGPALLPPAIILASLKPLLEDPEFIVVGQNFKFDMKVLRRYGIHVARLGFDTMLAAWLLDAGAGRFNLEALGLQYLGVKGVAFEDLVPKGKTFADVPLAQAGQYGAEDADLTWRLYEVLKPKLIERDLFSLLVDLELPLSLLLSHMEERGIRLKTEQLTSFGEELAQRIGVLEQEIFELCGGKTFNLGSPKQLQEILFVDRQLTPPPRAKIKSGYSTDSDILEELSEQDPVPAKILAWRTLSKLKSTYVDTLPALVNPVTGRLHTQYVQTGTATGRIASKDPNLQNIPIREDDGRRIREAFVPEDSWVFVSADYSQIELVVLAHLCQDPNLVAAFREGLDVHRRTASIMFSVDEPMVTADMRRAAKAINFGLMYGMSAFRLANELKIPRKEAQQFFDAYKREFAGVDTFFQTIIHEAEKTGEVTTLLGHRRALPNIAGRNRVEKQAAERIAMNTPIQGSAADIVKTAMLRVDGALQKEGLKARLLLQVHDELLLEVPHDEVERVQVLLRREMEGAFPLSVPLRVGIEVGETWGALH